MKQNPSLIVAAQPVSTYVDPGKLPTAGLELYDEQQVRLALEFSDSFSSLSTTAARIAGQLKEDWNKEEFESGKDLVRQNQKSYITLVEEGKIKPSENPWLALGAQEASGLVEGMKARREFQEYYNKKAAQDPKFFDDSTGFDALASSFVMNKEAQFKDSVFLSRSFHESFDSFVPQMALSHENEVVKRRVDRVVGGIDASTLQLVDNLYILNNRPSPELEGYFSIPETIRRPIEELQQEHLRSIEQASSGYINDFVGSLQSAEAAIGRDRTNKSVIESLINLRAEGTYSKEAKYLMENLYLGTGLLFETEDAKAAVAANWPKIVAGDLKYTDDKRRQYSSGRDQLLQSLSKENKIGEVVPAVLSLHEVLLDNLPVDEQTREQLGVQFGKDIGGVIETVKTQVVSDLIKQHSDQVASWLKNPSIVGTDLEENYIVSSSIGAFIDDLGISTQTRGLSFTGEEVLKIAGQAEEAFRKSAKNARNLVYLLKAEAAFNEFNGTVSLSELQNAFVLSLQDPSNIGNATIGVAPALARFDQAVLEAQNTTEDPTKQGEIGKYFYRQFKKSILPQLKALGREIKNSGGPDVDLSKYRQFTSAAELIYSFGLDMSSRTGDTELFSILVNTAKNAINSYNPADPVDPMTSAIIRSLGNVTDAQLDAVEKKNQGWQEIANVVQLIREARNYGVDFSGSTSERDVIASVQNTMQRRGINLITSQPQTNLSFEHKQQLTNLFKQKVNEERLNPGGVDATLSLIMSYSTRGLMNTANTWDPDVETWGENAIEAFEKDFLLFRDSSYVDKNGLINAFRLKDIQTGALVLPSESDAALYLDILLTHHPRFKDFPEAAIVVAQYPTIQNPDFKYAIVTKNGDPIVDKVMGLEEIVAEYWTPQKAKLLVEWSNKSRWKDFVKNQVAPWIPKITPIIPIPMRPTALPR